MAQPRATATGPGSTRRSPTPPSSSSRARLPLLVAAAVAVVLAVLAAAALWAATRAGGDTDTVAARGVSGQAGEVTVAHVHGLGIDPADGAVLAGTHYGLFRLPANGAPELVADRVQDFMGFTVVGPDHYLASGHPGAGQGGPSALGLIESTDGGETWETLSLAGEADFHALEARHDKVYGLNATTGQFLVSDDGRTWGTRNSGIALADFAVSPDDPDVLVATTQDGPARSTDGGRSFSVLAGAPLLLLVDWSDDGILVGVAPDGAVHVSEDGGATWEDRGGVEGSPQALEASDGGQVVVAIDGAIVESSDGGQSFDVRYRTG